MKATIIQPRYFNIWEAIGLGYIGAYARKYFPGPLELDFFQGYFDSDDSIIETASTSDIVAFSCTSPTYGHALSLAKEIKKHNPNARTVFGGFHPSAVPEDCIAEEVVDQVIVGEGEKAFLESLKGNATPILLGERFDELSSVFPDRDFIKNNRTVDLCQQQTGMRITSFQSVRGCPFKCAFCAERVVTGNYDRKANPLRIRNAEHLLDEIELVADKYRLDSFKFADATWNTSIESFHKIISFCESKIKRNFKLPWEANIHASFATREMLEIMKAADCQMINVGCESGSQKILNQMKKGLSVEKIRDVFHWGRELGLLRRGFFLIGMPDETLEDIRLTEKLVEDIEPDVFGVTILCPYPGSDLYDKNTMKNFDWSVADEYSNPYWSTKYLSNEELKKCQKRLLSKFSKNLAWHHKIIK